MRKDQRAVLLFRGELIAQRDRGSLKPSTAKVWMRAVIQFYRHCLVYGLVDRKSAMWSDREVATRYFDAAGFQRTIMRMPSDLVILNKTRSGLRLEDGLSPLRTADATRLLEFAKKEGLTELHLMLSLGVLTGARLETIVIVRRRPPLPDAQSVESIRPQPQTRLEVCAKGDGAYHEERANLEGRPTTSRPCVQAGAGTTGFGTGRVRVGNSAAQWHQREHAVQVAQSMFEPQATRRRRCCCR
ncbi:hypothetical protein J2W37_004676 [Variovorax paradoxus]|nr:hypothetical protein [Variovorax paradoxus]